MTKRVTMQLDPAIFAELKEWKDTIHELASRKRAPLSWNTFFMLVTTDWKNSLCKCNCGKIYHCDACTLSYKLMAKQAHKTLSNE